MHFAGNDSKYWDVDDTHTILILKGIDVRMISDILSTSQGIFGTSPNAGADEVKLFVLSFLIFNVPHSVHSHNALNIADPSSMQDTWRV